MERGYDHYRLWLLLLGRRARGLLGFGELTQRSVGSPFGRELRKELHMARRRGAGGPGGSDGLSDGEDAIFTLPTRNL